METAGEDGMEINDELVGLTRRIPDDCIEYRLCVIDASITSEAALRKRLKEVEQTAKQLVKTHLEGYIWQREPFKLELLAAKDPLQALEGETPQKQIGDADLPLPLSHTLYGQSNFGDSIADEWAIVHVLRELSRECPDVWIRVCDGDGEFLLVEAANALPRWLDPGIADNRIWIHRGQLRLLEEEDAPTETVNLSRAVTLIQQQPLRFSRHLKIEQAAFARLRDYPDAIQHNFHHAMVTVPRRLAYILHQGPARISAAVERFYLRDPIALKALSTKDTGTLYFPPEDFVTVSVKFTRVSYAQLQSQDFALPGSWSGVTPHITEPRVLIGMKLACGFEMLVQDARNEDKQVVREIKLLLEDIESGDEELPTNESTKKWSQQQDAEDWLDIKFEDLDKELADRTAAGRKEASAMPSGKSAQENLAKMVSGFQSFLDNDKAGIDGAGEDEDDNGISDDDDDSSTSSEPDSEGEDNEGSFNEAEFEQAMREMMGLSTEERESRGLLDEARRMALEMEEEDEVVEDEDEIRKLMEEMGAELQGLGALNRVGDDLGSDKAKGKGVADREWQVDDDSSEKTELVKNLLASLKNQQGSSGPASNMLAAMGIRMPRDDDDDDDGSDDG